MANANIWGRHGWILSSGPSPVGAAVKTGRIKVGDTVRYYGQARKYTVESVEGAEAILKYFTDRNELKLARAPLRDLVVHVEEPKPVRKR